MRHIFYNLFVGNNHSEDENFLLTSLLPRQLNDIAKENFSFWHKEASNFSSQNSNIDVDNSTWVDFLKLNLSCDKVSF